MRRRTCPFCGVDQQISEKLLSNSSLCSINVKCHQCNEISSYPTALQPVELDLRKLFVAPKKEIIKIPPPPHVQLAASKRRFAISVFVVLVSLNIFFAIKINSPQNMAQPEVQKFVLTQSAPLPTIPEKEIELKIVNQFEATVLVPKAIVRSGPGIENTAIHSLDQNEKILVKGWNKNWMNIDANKGNEKLTGWIRADLISGGNR
jgi:hypothetical protein